MDKLKKVWAIGLALFMAGCATKPEGVVIPPEVLTACKGEGGCTLISVEAMNVKMEGAFTAGFFAGSEAATKQRGGL